MASRNMEHIVKMVNEKGCEPPKYQMVLPELDRLHELIEKGKEFEALSMAFDFGFAMGCRATRRGKAKSI